MAESRKCEVKYSSETKEAKFIRFGDSIYFDDGNNAIPKTVAIVELDNGQVAEVDPYMIKFTDKSK